MLTLLSLMLILTVWVLPGSEISEQGPRKMQQEQMRKIDDDNKVRLLTQIGSIWLKFSEEPRMDVSHAHK